MDTLEEKPLLEAIMCPSKYGSCCAPNDFPARSSNHSLFTK